MSDLNASSLFGGGLDPRLEKFFTPLCESLQGRDIMVLLGEVNDHIQAIYDG